jgi:hypothetical protein
MKRTKAKYPSGWTERKVRRVLKHYESQTQDLAVQEDEEASQLRGQALIVVPKRLVPQITRLIQRDRSRSNRAVK